jgi:hypothetical protein
MRFRCLLIEVTLAIKTFRLADSRSTLQIHLGRYGPQQGGAGFVNFGSLIMSGGASRRSCRRTETVGQDALVLQGVVDYGLQHRKRIELHSHQQAPAAHCPDGRVPSCCRNRAAFSATASASCSSCNTCRVARGRRTATGCPANVVQCPRIGLVLKPAIPPGGNEGADGHAAAHALGANQNVGLDAELLEAQNVPVRP